MCFPPHSFGHTLQLSRHHTPLPIPFSVMSLLTLYKPTTIEAERLKLTDNSSWHGASFPAQHHPCNPAPLPISKPPNFTVFRQLPDDRSGSPAAPSAIISLFPFLPLSLSPSFPLSLSPSLPLSLSPSLPLSLSPSCPFSGCYNVTLENQLQASVFGSEALTSYSALDRAATSSGGPIQVLLILFTPVLNRRLTHDSLYRKEALSSYKTSSGVRLFWELEAPKGPKGSLMKCSKVHFSRAQSLLVRSCQMLLNQCQDPPCVVCDAAVYPGCPGDQ